jgi:hypothetical protein
MNYSLGNMLGGSNGSLNPDKLSLDLQFATDKTLTARKGPTPVFTRASTATYYGPLINIAGYMLAIPTTGGITNGRAVWFKSDGELDVTIFYTGTQWKFTAQYPDDLYEFLATAGSEFRPDQANWFTSPVTSSSTFGLLTASINEPRFDHDPVTLACKGLLIEESRTNRAIRSDDFANAAWDQGSARNLTIESDNTTSPSGATDADKLTVGATTTTYNVVQLTPTLTSGVAYTFSAFFKANQITRVSMWTGSSTTLPVDAIFDLTGSGSVVLTSYGTASIQAYSNGWYRCVITGTAGASVLTTLRIGPASGVSRTYVGNSTDSFFAYGAQLEAGAFPTSYIPTTTSSVVRSADVCSITGSDFTGMYNQPEGTWNVGFTLTSSLTSTEYLIDKNTTGVPILYKITNLIRAGQNGQFQINSATTLVVGSVYKTAFAYKSGDYGLSVNGSTVVTSTYSANAPALPTDIFIGSRSSVAANSPISSIRYFKKRLANSKLQTLTQFVSDADANAYITSLLSVGAAVTPTQQDAINTFVKAGKADGWWSSLKRLYLPIWASAAPNAVDMITRASGTFNGTVTHSAGYVQGDGSTGYFDFGATPDALGLSVDGGMIGILVNQAPTIGVRRLISAQNFSNSVDIFEPTAGLIAGISRTGAASSTVSLITTSNVSGIFTHTRENNTSQRLSVRKTAGITSGGVQTTAATGSIPRNIVALARNSGGSISAFSDLLAGSYFAADDSFTYADEPNFTLALKNLWETCTSLSLP